MATQKITTLSSIAPATTPPAPTDQLVGVKGHTTDLLWTPPQLATAIAPYMPSSGGGGGGSGLPTLVTMAELRAYPIIIADQPPPDGSLVYLQGFHLPGDGGGGMFVWNGSSNIGDDGGTSINPDWNTSPVGGPNLIQNGNFADGAVHAHWNITNGDPVFSGNTVHDNGLPNHFWQITQTMTGLTIGASYIVSISYTLALGDDRTVNVVFGSVNFFTSVAAAVPTTLTISAVATATTMTLLLAGVNTPCTMTNVSVSLAPGGRYLRLRDDKGVYYPEWFGAVGDASTDDSAALIATIASAVNHAKTIIHGRSQVKLAPATIYASHQSLPVDITAVTITGSGGSVIDFSGYSGSTAAININTSATNRTNPYDNDVGGLSGFAIYQNTQPATSDGISFANATNDMVQGIQFEHMLIWGFATCINCSFNNVYFIGARKCRIVGEIGFSIRVAGNANAGEMMAIEDCSFGCNVGIDLSGPLDMALVNSSIDYPGFVFIRIDQGAIHVDSCHFETNRQTADIPAPPAIIGSWGTILAKMQVGSAGSIIMKNSSFVWTDGGNPPPILISCNAAAPLGIRMEATYWQWGGNHVWSDGRMQSATTLVPTVTTLDPTKTAIAAGGYLTLSNGNLTVTNNGFPSGYPGLSSFATTMLTKGKWYLSLTINTLAAGGLSMGFSQFGSEWIFQQVLSSGRSAWFNGLGQTGNDGSFAIVFPVPATAPGSVWWAAIDFTALQIWFSWDNGTTWHGATALGSPAAGTGGINIAGWYPSTLFPAFPIGLTPVVSFNNFNHPGDQVTMNFNPDISGVSGLSGFAAYGTAFTLGRAGSVTIEKSISSFEGWPALTDAGNSMNADPDFEASTAPTGFIDSWFISQDTAAITSRTTGTNIAIAVGTAKPFSGLQSMQITKTGAGIGAFAYMNPCLPLENHSYGIQYAASANGLGTIAANVKYGRFLYFGSNGVPVFSSNYTLPQGTTLTPTTTYQKGFFMSFSNTAPSWATHVLIEFNLSAFAAGTLYIDNAELYRF